MVFAIFEDIKNPNVKRLTDIIDKKYSLVFLIIFSERLGVLSI